MCFISQNHYERDAAHHHPLLAITLLNQKKKKIMTSMGFKYRPRETRRMTAQTMNTSLGICLVDQNRKMALSEVSVHSTWYQGKRNFLENSHAIRLVHTNITRTKLYLTLA